MQQLNPSQSQFVHGGESSSPQPAHPGRPAPIFKPVFPIEP